MADVITKFKLETTQFDSALRDASKELSKLAVDAKKAGADFSTFDKETINAARSLGKVESGAKNVKDRLRDLVGAYNNVANAYEKLTDEQKKSDFGKAMAQSLQTLQGRITETKNELYNAGGALEKLSEKFTLNIDVMKLFNLGLSAAKGALGVVKDAFFKNEQNLDEWGRTVKSCESLYDGFLVALNNGDISGYLRNIDNIVDAARNAYDALDTLSTFSAFNQINEMAGRTDLANAINDFRANGGDKSKVLAAAGAYKQELNTRKSLQQTAYEAEVARIAAIRGVSSKDLLSALSGSWGDYNALKAMPLTGTKTSRIAVSNGMSVLGPTYSTLTEKAPANEMERLGEALRQLNDTELKDLQALGASAKATGYEIANVDRQLVRVLGRNGAPASGTPGGRSGGGGRTTKAAPVGWLNIQQAKIQELRKQMRSATSMEDISNYQSQITAEKIYYDLLTGKIGGGVSAFKEPTFDMAKAVKKMERENADALNRTAEDKKQKGEAITASQALGSITGGVSSIVSGVEQLGIDVPDGIQKAIGAIQTVASILTGISAIVSVIQTLQMAEAFKFWSAGGVVHAAGGYRVPGNYGYDAVPSMLTSGELVLNSAQQNNVAGLLRDSRRDTQELQPYVDVDKIWLGLKHHLRQQGMGEIVTTGRA